VSRKEESEPLNKKVPKTKGKFVKGATIIGKKGDAKCVTVSPRLTSGSDVRRSNGCVGK
jgi:hypothetical protein